MISLEECEAFLDECQALAAEPSSRCDERPPL